MDRTRLQAYWPRTTYEDWSDKQQLTDRLTPYNWTYVQKVTVEHQGASRDVFVPRRCMHCDNPPCANLCPFSAHSKTPEGAVVIDESLCFGGAKCRDVCPWGIPQRQAGVGLYLQLAPKFAGGGVMYKCDLCIDRIRAGCAPACVDACPRNAIVYGEREAIRAEAHRRAKAIGGYIYGDHENGGTGTLYISDLPFEAINRAMLSQAVDGRPGRPAMPPVERPFTELVNGLAPGLLGTPLVGLATAGALALAGRDGRRARQAEPSPDDNPAPLPDTPTPTLIPLDEVRTVGGGEPAAAAPAAAPIAAPAPNGEVVS